MNLAIRDNWYWIPAGHPQPPLAITAAPQRRRHVGHEHSVPPKSSPVPCRPGARSHGRSTDGSYKLYWIQCRNYHRFWWNGLLTIAMVNHLLKDMDTGIVTTIVALTRCSAFIKPDQLDPWIKDQIGNTLLSTILHLQLPNFVSCGRDKPSHMTQNLVTVGAKL